MNLAVIIPVIVAIVGAAGAYFAAVKRLSGRITTSTAEELWAESRKLREDLGDRITQLNGVVERLTTENTVLKAQVENLKGQIAALRPSRRRDA